MMTPSEPPPTWSIPHVGDVVAGKYRVLGVLGQGGLAVVVAAMHEKLDERVALKILLPEWGMNDDVVARFLCEGRASIKIHSEHVVRVFDVGETDAGAPYIVMEYLDGCDLAKLLATSGPLPIEAAVDHIAQACEAIAEAHAHSIIHRDLKPANLYLTYRADGSSCIKVLDFGISKIKSRDSAASLALTNPGLVMGSPHYMSPEQLRSTCDADERSDVWALGACLHELLSGHPPFRGDTAPELCAHVLTEAPPRLSLLRADVPDALAAAVLVALEKTPADRFSNVGKLAKAIARYGSPVARASAERATRVLERAGIARPVTSSVDRSRFRNNHSALISAGVVILALLGGVLVTPPSFFRGETVASTLPAVIASIVPAAHVVEATGTSAARPNVTAALPAHAASSAPRGWGRVPAHASAPPVTRSASANDTLFDDRK